MSFHTLFINDMGMNINPLMDILIKMNQIGRISGRRNTSKKHQALDLCNVIIINIWFLFQIKFARLVVLPPMCQLAMAFQLCDKREVYYK